MDTNQDHIPILKQMLRSARQVVMDSIDGITERRYARRRLETSGPSSN